MSNKIVDLSQSKNLYVISKDIVKSNPFVHENTTLKIKRFDNKAFIIKQIFHAVQNGDLNFLQTIPKNLWKSFINILDDKNYNPLLHYAVIENHVEIIMFLLTFKPNINIASSKGIRPIHIAAQKNHVEIVELLCSQKGLMIDAIDNKGQTPLHTACRNGHFEVVKVLLKYGASVYKVETDKISVLHHPVRRGDKEMVKYLVSYNAPLIIKNNNGQTPIMIAAIEGHYQLLSFLIHKITEREISVPDVLNDQDNDGISCLLFAVQNKNTQIIKFCLNNGADINLKQDDGKTILHIAAITGYSELFQYIDISRMNVNEPDNNLNTPLHLSIINNNAEVTQLLLSNGAGINIYNMEFQTPILLACSEMSSSKNLCEIIKVLIAGNADLTIRDINRKSIFHHLVEKENIEILNYIIKIMDENPRKKLINAQDNLNNTPLHYASKTNNIQEQHSIFMDIDINQKQHFGDCSELSQLLLDAEADPKIFSQNDVLALHVAIKKGNLDMVKLLLHANSDTKYYRDVDEHSAIHIAAHDGKFDIFTHLVNSGKDVLAKDEFGRNSLMFAAKSGSLTIVDFLISKNVNVNLYDQMKMTALHLAANEGHLEIVQNLWKNGAIFLDNVYGHSPLDIALINKQDHIVKFFLNEKNWYQVLSYRHKNGSSHIENLIQYNEECTMELLDKCVIENTTNKFDPNYEIKYWFWIIDAGPDDISSINERYHALMSMAKYKRLNLLHHPLSEKLMKIKWMTFGLWFSLTDLLFYLIYLFLIIYYIGNNIPMLDSDVFDFKSGCNINSTNQTNSKGDILKNVQYSHFLIYIIIAIRFLMKIVKIYNQKVQFLFEIWNYSFTFCEILTLYFLSDPTKIPCIYQWQTAPLLMLVAFYLILYYLEQFPQVGIIVMMYQKVLRNVLMVLFTFSALIMGFGYGFYIINSNMAPFKSQGLSFIKTSIMMTGEIDFDTYFVGKKNYYYISLMLITAFLVIMQITLLNLLIGLAVGDIDQMAKKATLAVLRLRINYAWNVESKLPLRIQRYFYTIEFVEHPNRKRKSRFNF